MLKESATIFKYAIIVTHQFNPSPLSYVEHFLIKDVLETLIIGKDCTLYTVQIAFGHYRDTFSVSDALSIHPLKGTPAVGVQIHYYPGVLGGDTCDGYIWFSLHPGSFEVGNSDGYIRAIGSELRLQAMIDQGVIVALAARDAIRSMNGEDSHNSGTGVRRNERATHECTYPDFMKCQLLNFKGTEGVVELTQWVEKMETVFRISNCSVENQIKLSTCTLLGNALTWWNSHVRTVGNDVAYTLTWTELKKKMTDKYYPRTKIKKFEVELWDLKVKGTNVIGYNQRFQELALLCVRMFPEKSDKIERYVGGLPDMIHGSVVASKPKTMQEATEIATQLIDKRIRTFAKRQTENKKKQDDKQQQQQQQNKRQNTDMAYTTTTKQEAKQGLRGTGAGQKPTCYECGNQGHYKSDCPKLKNRNHENQDEGTKARGMVYALGGGETNQDPNNIEDEIET
ncbi:reverse transcriptase domain-containing protein [Tanacetum coccineum]